MATEKPLGSEAKDIVAKVYNRMEYEAQNGVENITDAKWRTSQAVGVTEETVMQILRDATQANTSQNSSNKNINSPTKRKRKRARCESTSSVEPSDFDMPLLRRTLISFHKCHSEFKEFPTLSKLKQVLNERIGFEGCEENLCNILMQCGYEWSNTGNSKILSEKQDIQMSRLLYIKQLQYYRNEGRYIVFTGESYIDDTHIQKEDKKILPVQKKTSKGMPIILVHAGGSDGFIKKAFLMYSALATNGDIHNRANYDHIKKWMANQLLPNLPENSVIIMNNNTYSNIFDPKCPPFNSNKIEMQRWLAENSIPYNENMNKMELYHLISENQECLKTYTIDLLIRSKGFEILQLPPHHTELNPTEKVWASLKDSLKKTNVAQNIASIMVVINGLIKNFGPVEWDNICQQVEELEQQYMQYFNLDYELVLHVDESVSDSSDSDSE